MTKKEVGILENWVEPCCFEIEIVKEGNCRAGHKLGERFEFEWNTPQGVCSESYVGMYPVIHSLRVLGDMRELGSDERNVRIYNCPSRVIQFRIKATYRCNLCGVHLDIISNGVPGKRLENRDDDLWVRVCDKCYEKYDDYTLVWSKS